MRKLFISTNLLSTKIHFRNTSCFIRWQLIKMIVLAVVQVKTNRYLLQCQVDYGPQTTPRSSICYALIKTFCNSRQFHFFAVEWGEEEEVNGDHPGVCQRSFWLDEIYKSWLWIQFCLSVRITIRHKLNAQQRGGEGFIKFHFFDA